MDLSYIPYSENIPKLILCNQKPLQYQQASKPSPAFCFRSVPAWVQFIKTLPRQFLGFQASILHFRPIVDKPLLIDPIITNNILLEHPVFKTPIVKEKFAQRGQLIGLCRITSRYKNSSHLFTFAFGSDPSSCPPTHDKT